MSDQLYPEGEQDEAEGAWLSPETVLEQLSFQASESALFPGSLREEYFFAYDLLLDQAAVSRFVKALQIAHIARVPHHRLVWPYYYPPVGSALPSLLRTNRDTDSVWGVLYNARGKDFSALTQQLRVPNRYHRRAVITLDRGERRFVAFTYVVTLHDLVMRQPSPGYLSQLIAAAAERGLPEEWLAALRATETATEEAAAGQ